ncbi:MAG: putative porin [Bacteroidales bacterium]
MLRKLLIGLILCFGGSLIVFAQPLQRKDSVFRMMQYPISVMLRVDSSAYDSSLTRLPYLNPYMPDDNFYTYCTRSGNPFLSNIITDRLLQRSYFFPQNSFASLVQNKQNSDYYYLTNAPFTSVTYKFQGIVQSKEEMVDIVFARRISRASHLGFSYRLFSNRSETDYQRANDHSMYMYWVTPGKSYFHLTQLYYNTFEFKENGGNAADSLINYSTSDFYGTQVRLDNATSRLMHWGIHSTHQWYLNRLFGAEGDSTSRRAGGLAYRFSMESNKKFYSEGNPNSSFYPHYYSRRGSLTDSILLWQVTNLIQLNAPVLTRYLPDLRASLSHTYYESFHGANIDTIRFSAPSHSWQNYSQVWLQGEVGYHFPVFTAQVNWKSCVAGYGWGDQQLHGLIRFKGAADSASYIQLNLLSRSQTPSFLMKSIFSNHYIWNKGDSLDREYIQQVGGELYARPLQVRVGVDYYLLKNYLYFDEHGFNQTRDWQHIVVVAGNHLLKAGGFSLQSKLWYQFFDEKYFHLPHWGIFQTAAFSHTFVFSTGGRLFARLGIDFKYYSRYLPDNYLPPLGVFALTSKDALEVTYAGDYPIFNVHLTFKVKNVSFYVKYGHLNAWWNTRTFVAAHYPMLPATLSYGINWMFYDW